METPDLADCSLNEKKRVAAHGNPHIPLAYCTVNLKVINMLPRYNKNLGRKTIFNLLRAL